MRDDSRLGQSCGSRGIDIDELVVVVNLRLVGLLRAGRGQQSIQILGLGNVLLRRLTVVVLVIELEQGEVSGQILGHVGDSLVEVLAVNEGRAMGHRDAVQQGRAAQVRVNQGSDHTDLGQTQPGGHIFGTVLQQQGNHIALLIALRLQHICHPVGMLVDLAEGPALRLADHGHLVGMGAHIPLENVGHRVVETLMALGVPQELDVGPESSVYSYYYKQQYNIKLVELLKSIIIVLFG